MENRKIAVLFGGQSSEHEVSCISAATIIDNIDKENYDVIMIGITKEGKWLWVDSLEELTSGAWVDGEVSACISPDATEKAVIKFSNNVAEKITIDVAFPVLHGLYGEDGTVQGLLELARIPYVGCGVLSSAVSMDKWYTKIIVDTLGIRQAKYVPVWSRNLKKMEQVLDAVEAKLQYPVFVKPSNAGSSQGVSKAADRAALKKALLLAAEHDKKILVEETILGREIECAILGSDEPQASGVGEIITTTEFYDFEAKYHDETSKTILQPILPEGAEKRVRDAAVRIFKAVDGFGLARVDFFLEKVTNEVVFNEINTLPGFTSISMYPMLWETKGIAKKVLVEKLIALAQSRFTE